MAVLKKYWVPDYYAGFHCKGPDCRSSCCHGWGISLSMKEYFRLLGMDCEPNLRRKLDCSFHLVDSPTEERYAQITPDWRGDCPLHMENGYCMLQAECGEDTLTHICRYYPRSPRTLFSRECACSNSCEAVLEKLFEHEDPLRFEEREMTFELPEETFDGPEWVAENYRQVRILCITTLQNRAMHLWDRLILLGRILEKLHQAFRQQDDGTIKAALDECRAMQAKPSGKLSDEDGLIALNIQHRMGMVFGENSQSLQEYAHAIEQAMGLEGEKEPSDALLREALHRYRDAAEHFENVLPEWERLFEQMLVNHIFYESFPFSDRYENLWEEYLSLCAVYSFVRYLAVCWMRDKHAMNDFVDVCAAAFRLIDHSGFDWNAEIILKSMNLDTMEAMEKLVRA